MYEKDCLDDYNDDYEEVVNMLHRMSTSSQCMEFLEGLDICCKSHVIQISLY